MDANTYIYCVSSHIRHTHSFVKISSIEQIIDDIFVLSVPNLKELI